jgi:hypothetical protein
MSPQRLIYCGTAYRFRQARYRFRTRAFSSHGASIQIQTIYKRIYSHNGEMRFFCIEARVSSILSFRHSVAWLAKHQKLAETCPSIERAIAS